MTQTKWITARQVAIRYGVNSKWPWHQMKRDTRFPRGVRFSNKMTRWNTAELDEYDAALSAK
jgi:predicted DNA-binding transcriptional regulator AlpA